MTERAEPSRPTLQSEEVVSAILARIADGESVRSILRAEDMPARSTWHEWLLADDTLQKRYAVAAELGAESEFDEIQEIADDGSRDWSKREEGDDVLNHEHVQRSKLRVDAKKWRLARKYPKKYGDRIEQVHTDPQGGSPFAALMEAIEAGGRPRPSS